MLADILQHIQEVLGLNAGWDTSNPAAFSSVPQVK
jgi:hypothetical protein